MSSRSAAFSFSFMGAPALAPRRSERVTRGGAGALQQQHERIHCHHNILMGRLGGFKF
jgi:hypothetical protein